MSHSTNDFKIKSNYIDNENFYYFLLKQPEVKPEQLKIGMYYLINRKSNIFYKVEVYKISDKEILAKNGMGALISISLSELREISDDKFDQNIDYHAITRKAGGRKPRTHKRGRLHKNRSRRNK
jgi:hypothetical protein